MGVVYLARDSIIDRRVALKTLRIDIDPRERQSQALEQLFSGAMALDLHEEPGTVNRDWILFMEAAEDMDPARKNEAFRDKIPLAALHQLLGITVKNREKIQTLYHVASQDSSTEPTDWLAFDSETLRATVQGLPGPSDISLPVNVNIVIEFMSR